VLPQQWHFAAVSQTSLAVHANWCRLLCYAQAWQGHMTTFTLHMQSFVAADDVSALLAAALHPC
jgi:hypothetical protein